MNDWFEKTSHTRQTHFWKCPNTKSVSVHRSTGSIIKLKKEKMTVHHLQKTSMA